MISGRGWEEYPSPYRKREMAMLGRWIQAGESGSIVGLRGSGKSNLLGFITHKPQSVSPYVNNSQDKLALVYVDLNNLVNNDVATFYRVILRSLYEARTQFAAIDEALSEMVVNLYRQVEDKVDAFVSQSALREILLLFSAHEVRLVLVFDPFDQFCREATTQVLDTLRGLRDSFKMMLSYLVGLRQELRYVRDPLELSELYELLDTHLCWIGGMEDDDARWVIQQVELTMARSFTEAQVKALLTLTGGYPSLLKAASLWLASAAPIPDTRDWKDQLLAEPSIQNRLHEIWQGLTSQERAVLSVLETAPSTSQNVGAITPGLQIEKDYQETLTHLQMKGLCEQTSSGWQIFSPLFAALANKDFGQAGKIWYQDQTDHFMRGEIRLDSLSEKDRLLLGYFLAQPVVAHAIDDLIQAAWPEDESDWVSNAAVQQAIRHLRKQIEPNPSQPIYLVNERSTGYRFFPEGRPASINEIVSA